MMMMMMMLMLMLMRTSSRNNTIEMVFMSSHFFIFECRYEGKREKISGSSLSTMATPTISLELEGIWVRMITFKTDFSSDPPSTWDLPRTRKRTHAMNPYFKGIWRWELYGSGWVSRVGGGL